jgi:hypothetical protein
MHVPGHNPFITQSEQGQFNIDAILNYLSGIQGEPDQGGAGFSQSGPTYQIIPEYAQQTVGFDVSLPTFQYQGISPEIMQALQNVFIPGSEGFPGTFFTDLATSQIESQLPGLVLEGQITPESQEYLDAIQNPMSGAPTVGLQDVEIDPTLVSIASIMPQNIESGLGFTNIFDPESIAATLAEISGNDIQAAEVKALTPEMIEKTTSEYYSPYEESERESLVEKLGTAMSKAQTGGFAGSGARQSGLSGAERLYRGGYGDILSDIMKMRGQATGDVLDTIYGYQELLDQTG